MGFLIAIIVGALAGWLAGLIVKGGGQGLLINVIVGIVGGVVAGFLFPALGLYTDGSLIGAVVSSTIGAVVLLFVLSLFKKA